MGYFIEFQLAIVHARHDSVRTLQWSC